MKKRYKILIVFGVILTLLFAFGIYFRTVTAMKPPRIENTEIQKAEVIRLSDSLWQCDDSWLHQNTNGVWELFVSGTPFELGVKNGKLTQKLAEKQEDAFFSFIQSIVPSSFMLQYLKYFIAWFNKDLDDYIPLSIQEEIYGISLYAPKKYNFIASNYHRILNYHAAHDIGHTIQNMNLIGCTAFGLKENKTVDGELLIGRNFDFAAGDDFAKNKIIAFCKPKQGYAFMYVTWGGMIGVLSGMNEHGLTVTLNSAKSDIPTSAKTPVCIVARLILQNAKNIDEAFSIAKKYNTFVSEMFFIGSAYDNKCAIIDKSITETALYEKKGDDIILTNFFQSDKLMDAPLNQEAIQEGSSMYRFKKVEELLNSEDTATVENIAKILRNQKGLDESNIGMGNEKAINQLICHHSIIFKPAERLVWVSDYPYQIGEYKCYDLKKAFVDNASINDIYRPQLNIKADTFLHSKLYANFIKYKEKSVIYKSIIDNEKDKTTITNDEIKKFIQLNPDYYYTHYISALLMKRNGIISEAISQLEIALTKECPRLVDRQQVEDELKELKEE